jgi:hypothetical protein
MIGQFMFISSEPRENTWQGKTTTQHIGRMVEIPKEGQTGLKCQLEVHILNPEKVKLHHPQMVSLTDLRAFKNGSMRGEVTIL